MKNNIIEINYKNTFESKMQYGGSTPRVSSKDSFQDLYDLKKVKKLPNELFSEDENIFTYSESRQYLESKNN